LRHPLFVLVSSSFSSSPNPDDAQTRRLSLLLLTSAAALAVCGAALLARNVSPSATFFNQAVALGGWALFLALTTWLLPPGRAPNTLRRGVPAILALTLLAFATGLSSLFERLPSALSLSGFCLLAAALLTLVVATRAAPYKGGRIAFQAFCVALLAAGILSLLVAIIQVFASSWAEGDWVARIAAGGRASGNLRQPNHLSSLLLWSIAALVWLHEMEVEKQQLEVSVALRAITAAVIALLLFGVVLTVSRTGTACVLLLALWGVVDKRLSRFSRVLLCLAPVVYVLSWLGMSELWQGAQGFAGDIQLHKSDPSSSRFGIWSNTFELIKQNPWFGVGWGEFNFAWTLTPFPGRPTAFFDHTHNLPLQFLVELGIPLGTLVLGLLLWALWKAFRACITTPEPDSRMVRTAFVMVLMMVVHSMLEYPLWYAYFLLPTAFALGICLGHSGPPSAQEPETSVAPSSTWLRRTLIGASIALMIGTVASVVDYMRVVAIFSASEDEMPLSYRIAEGQKSWFFAHHADYAAATVAERPSDAMKAFRRAPHFLLDTRLMMAWAKAYNERGDVERLREFRNPDAADFFAECDKPLKAGESKPFQCTPATRHFTYEDFKMRSN
jgi:O-antigen ligase